MPLALLPLIVLALCAHAAAGEALLANRPLPAQLIDLDGAPTRYRLEGLKPRTGYEVRVSYPASIPANIHIELVGAPAQQAGKQELRRAARRLLDCDKIVFWTDAHSRPSGIAGASVTLQASRASPHRDGPGGGPRQLVFDIVLAELWLGIPIDLLPLIAVVVLLVAAVALFVPSWEKKLFPQLLDWVVSGSSAGAEARQR